MLPMAKPVNTPISDMKLMKPLQRTVWMLEKPFFIKIPTSPISRGISCAKMAMMMGTMVPLSLVAKAMPIPSPSKKL